MGYSTFTADLRAAFTPDRGITWEVSLGMPSMQQLSIVSMRLRLDGTRSPRTMLTVVVDAGDPTVAATILAAVAAGGDCRVGGHLTDVGTGWDLMWLTLRSARIEPRTGLLTLTAVSREQWIVDNPRPPTPAWRLQAPTTTGAITSVIEALTGVTSVYVPSAAGGAWDVTVDDGWSTLQTLLDTLGWRLWDPCDTASPYVYAIGPAPDAGVPTDWLATGDPTPAVGSIVSLGEDIDRGRGSDRTCIVWTSDTATGVVTTIGRSAPIPTSGSPRGRTLWLARQGTVTQAAADAAAAAVQARQAQRVTTATIIAPARPWIRPDDTISVAGSIRTGASALHVVEAIEFTAPDGLMTITTRTT